MKLVLSLILLWCCGTVRSYKILGVFPHMGKSHFDFFRPITRELAKRGHDITVISHFPEEKSQTNYTDISIKNVIEIPSINSIDMNDYDTGWLHRYLVPVKLALLGRQSCVEGLSHENFQSLIKSKTKFDLIIIEMFNTRCFLGLAHKFNAPLIALSSCTLMPYLDSPMGHPNNPSYIPNNLLGLNVETFWERIQNTVNYIYHNILFNVVMDIFDNWDSRKYIAEDTPPLEDIAANISLMLLNAHFTYTTPRPAVPGYVEVAGLHITNTEKLPKELFGIFNEQAYISNR